MTFLFKIKDETTEKHPFKRTEAIWCVCWISKTEEKRIKKNPNQIRIPEEEKKMAAEKKKGLFFIVREQDQSFALCQVPFRLDKVNKTTWWKRAKGSQWMAERAFQAGCGVWNCMKSERCRQRERDWSQVLSCLSYLMAGYRLTQIITALLKTWGVGGAKWRQRKAGGKSEMTINHSYCHLNFCRGPPHW